MLCFPADNPESGMFATPFTRVALTEVPSTMTVKVPVALLGNLMPTTLLPVLNELIPDIAVSSTISTYLTVNVLFALLPAYLPSPEYVTNTL